MHARASLRASTDLLAENSCSSSYLQSQMRFFSDFVPRIERQFNFECKKTSPTGLGEGKNRVTAKRGGEGGELVTPRFTTRGVNPGPGITRKNYYCRLLKIVYKKKTKQKRVADSTLAGSLRESKCNIGFRVVREDTLRGFSRETARALHLEQNKLHSPPSQKRGRECNRDHESPSSETFEICGKSESPCLGKSTG